MNTCVGCRIVNIRFIVQWPSICDLGLECDQYLEIACIGQCCVLDGGMYSQMVYVVKQTYSSSARGFYNCCKLMFVGSRVQIQQRPAGPQIHCKIPSNLVQGPDWLIKIEVFIFLYQDVIDPTKIVTYINCNIYKMEPRSVQIIKHDRMRFCQLQQYWPVKTFILFLLLITANHRVMLTKSGSVVRADRLFNYPGGKYRSKVWILLDFGNSRKVRRLWLSLNISTAIQLTSQIRQRHNAMETLTTRACLSTFSALFI